MDTELPKAEAQEGPGGCETGHSSNNTPQEHTEPAEAVTTAVAETPAGPSSDNTGVAEGASTGDAVKKEKKPVLISRKADFSIAEMMRQLRDGEMERSVQPTVKATKVVKREKTPLQPPAAQKREAAKKPQHPSRNTATTVVVVTTTGEEASSTPPAQRKDGNTSSGKAAVDKSLPTTTYAETVKTGSKHMSEGADDDHKQRGVAAEEVGTTTPPPPPPQQQRSAKTTPVKQGSVKKRSKKEGKQAAAAAPKAPAPNVTTVKAKMSLEELRALRNRGSAMAAAIADAGNESNQPSSPDDGEARILDEISTLLLRYCMGGTGSHQPHGVGGEEKKLDPKAWPALSDTSNAPEPPAKGSEGTAEEGEEAAATTVTAATPEMELYNRLTELCQDKRVTSSTLDLLHELLKHTRVIPLRPQPVSSGEAEGTTSAGRDGGCGAVDEADTQAEEASRRRLYAQQIILVLINQMKQKKLMEEQRSQLRELQQQQQSRTAGSAPGVTKLSAFSPPFIPASVAAAQGSQPFTNGSRVTTFAPQSAGTSAAAPTVRIPSLATAQRSSVPQQQQQQHVSSSATQVSTGEDDMKQFLDVLRDRLVQSTTEPLVSISAEERRVLREIQQSFKQQQQQQQQQWRMTSQSATPASFTSSQPASLTFDPAQAAGPVSPPTTVQSSRAEDADSSGSNTTHGRPAQPQQLSSTGLPATTGAPSAHRTVFTYKTLMYDPSSSSAEDVPGLATAAYHTSGGNPTSFNRDAKPFVPGTKGSGGNNSSNPSNARGVYPTTTTPTAAPHVTGLRTSAMNAAAPAFVPPTAQAATPSARPAPTRAPGGKTAVPAPPAPPQLQPPQPWASPEMFAQWKKSMEDYYRSLTYNDFAAAMLQQQHHQ